MVNFSETEFESLFQRIPTYKKNVKRPKAYSILINGEIFTTSKGKSVWKQKNHASCAFTLEMYDKVRNVVRLRLQSQGVSRYDVYNYPEYRTAWDDFKAILIEKDLIKIVELQ